MDIDKYLQITNMDYKQYKNIRFNHYKKKHGCDLKIHEFENMLRYVPENCMDSQFFHKYIENIYERIIQ